MADVFELAGQTYSRCSRGMARLPVTVDLDGGEVCVWVHVLAGAKPGPTLLLMGMQHGDEWGEIEFFRRVVRDIDVAALSGTLLVIPVCSPTALGTLTRLSQFSADGPDLNRIWPGGNNWIPEMVAKVVSREVLPKVDAILDFHFGMWGNCLGIMTYGNDYPHPGVNEATRRLAFAYGFPLLHRVPIVSGYPGPRSLTGYAGYKHHIPAVACEIGGMGFGVDAENAWHDLNQRGVRNVMRHLGMIPGQPELPERFLDFSVYHRVDPKHGGLLVPEQEKDQFGRAVTKGEVLARVISPYTFAELEQLVAPCDGILSLVPRTCPVRPGDWAFFVADTSAADSVWVTGL
jgi:uncharacterized protein